MNARFSKRALKKYDRAFDAVTWAIAAAHVAALALLITNLLPAWAFVVIMVVTRTALAGAGHYHLHRKWRDRRRFILPIGKALFDINYVGTSLIGTDGHVLLHHPYMGSGADVKKTFFDGMLRLHPLLRIPGYTLHKLGICLSGLSLRAREIARFEAPKGQVPVRADFWLIRAWIVIEFAACLATGHIVAWLVQFFLTLWFNTFLVVASHDFEESNSEAELAVIPEPLRNDWAAWQICLSYDLSVVGNRWIDLFLSAGLSPHRVHHVLPYHGSGFANLATEQTVREVCAEARHCLGAPPESDLRAFADRYEALSSLPGQACSAAAARHACAARPAAAIRHAAAVGPLPSGPLPSGPPPSSAMPPPSGPPPAIRHAAAVWPAAVVRHAAPIRPAAVRHAAAVRPAAVRHAAPIRPAARPPCRRRLARRRRPPCRRGLARRRRPPCRRRLARRRRPPCRRRLARRRRPPCRLLFLRIRPACRLLRRIRSRCRLVHPSGIRSVSSSAIRSTAGEDSACDRSRNLLGRPGDQGQPRRKRPGSRLLRDRLTAAKAGR